MGHGGRDGNRKMSKCVLNFWWYDPTLCSWSCFAQNVNLSEASPGSLINFHEACIKCSISPCVVGDHYIRSILRVVLVKEGHHKCKREGAPPPYSCSNIPINILTLWLMYAEYIRAICWQFVTSAITFPWVLFKERLSINSNESFKGAGLNGRRMRFLTGWLAEWWGEVNKGKWGISTVLHLRWYSRNADGLRFSIRVQSKGTICGCKWSSGVWWRFYREFQRSYIDATKASLSTFSKRHKRHELKA